MRRPAKLHPTDIRDQEWIARAAHFTAFCQRGPRDRRRSQHDTQAEAEEAGRVLSADMGGKPALVYAVTPEGRSAFIRAVTAADAPKEGADMTPEDPQTADALFAAPPDPLMVDGVRYPNKTRAAEARRLVAAKMAVPTALTKPTRKRAAPKGQHPAIKAVTFTPTGKTAEELAVIQARTDTTIGKRAKAVADAQQGIVPTPPDFTADTHRRYRAQRLHIIALVDARDVGALRAEAIKTTGSSGKALDRYRQLAIVALEAGA